MLVYPKNRYDQSMVKLFMGRNRLAKGAEENSLKMEHGQYHLGSYGKGGTSPVGENVLGRQAGPKVAPIRALIDWFHAGDRMR